MTVRAKYGSVLLLTPIVLPFLGALAGTPQIAAHREKLEVAELYLELNATDGDLGIHGLFDGETWTRLEIEGPGERSLLDVVSRGPLRAHGLTELFFETAEPSFDELAPAEFLRRFPEGKYEIEGRLLEGGEIRGTAILSHVLAAPPANVTISGVPSAENCDSPVLPIVNGPVRINWDPVTTHHATIGKPGPVKIRLYQLFVESERVKFGVDLPPSITEFEVPAGIAKLGEEFKFEIIARTITGNNTAVESCFIVK